MSPSDKPSKPHSDGHADEIATRLLRLVESSDYRPAKPLVLAKRLKIEESDIRLLKQVIKRLIHNGKLAWGPKHLVLRRSAKSASPSPKAPTAPKPTPARAPASNRIDSKRSAPTSRGTTRRPDSSRHESKGVSATRHETRRNESEGIFRRASAGYGFVIPPGAVAGDRSGDVFVPPRKTLDAVSGDRVRVRLSKRRDGDQTKLSGEIIEVLERRTVRFVGTYRERGGFGLVVVDGGAFDSAILVGDAGAKNCRPGEKVVIEMVRFPSVDEQGEAVVVEVLGPRGKPGVDTLSIIHEFGLPGEFPEAALAEARAQAEAFAEDKGKQDRFDFTRQTVITIDPATARDFDDAISLHRLDNGHWQLGVHIADVAHFVPRGSPLDKEAYARGNSVYLPDRVIPMLPEIISNNLASLQPNRRRFTMSVLIEFTENATVIGADWYRGVIKSAQRFNYEEIDDFLVKPEPWREKLTPDVFRLVRDMHTLAMTMRKRRMSRGAIDLVLPDVKIDLDDDGRVVGAHSETYTESHQMIEEFMLAANEAVAQKLVDNKLFLLRRVHEPPSEKKLTDLTEFVRHLGYKCESLQSRFEIKRIVDLSRNKPEQQAVHFAVLRSMQKAAYSPRESGHYALASDAYCHFTSPIRRYPDLVIHRMVADMIDLKRPQSDFDRLGQIGLHCSGTEQRAEQAERELTKLKLLGFFVEKIGMEIDTVVTGVESFGLFAQGIKLPVEGLLHLEHLPIDRYMFDPLAKSLIRHKAGNEFRLGDKLTLKIRTVDLDRREMDFEFLSKLGTYTSTNHETGKTTKRVATKPSQSARPAQSRSNRGSGKNLKPRSSQHRRRR